jgi:predicted dehydrogenase
MGQREIRLGLLGAGSFATSTLLPAITRTGGVELVTACAASGLHADYAARKFGFRNSATDERQLCDDPQINTVVIATRHHLHARQVIAAFQAGKHVFCEKPLCLSEAELLRISAARDEQAARRPILMVGFNRRFAKLSLGLKKFLGEIGEPLSIHYRVNAGFLPADHWLNDPAQGGGRILGEVCHFVDYLSFLTGASPVEVHTRSLPNPGPYSNDNVVCWLRFSNGSQGTITYLANGDKSYSKERVEVFGGGCVAVLEDFRRLELVRGGSKKAFRSRWGQDKGHRGEWEAFIKSIQTGAQEPIPFREIASTMLATLALEESRCLAQAVSVKELPGPEHLLTARSDRSRSA